MSEVQNNTKLDCGARRSYRRLGVKPGPWIKELEILKGDSDGRDTHSVEAKERVLGS